MRKTRKPKCIVCEKELSLLYSDSEAGLRKEYVKNDIMEKFYNHVNTLDSTMVTIEPGYGSKFDLDKIVIGICDDCLENSISRGSSFYV